MNQDEGVLESQWFTTPDSLVGIVLYQTSTGELKSYIGTGNGSYREADEQKIAQFGAKFPNSAAASIFNISKEKFVKQ